jgi:hypothetical protein
MANAYVTGTAFASFGELISLFVEMLVSAGWTYRASGDGTGGTYNATGKVFTGTGAGALGWANSGAWARIQDPGAVREITVQHNNAGGAIIKYSQLAKFTGGSPSATTTPTATDERAIRGTYATAWCASSTGNAFGCANDTAQYGFWFAATSTSTVTFSVASPGNVNLTAHGITAPVASSTSATVRFATAGTLPAALSTTGSYFVTATPTANAFQISSAISTTTGINFADAGTGAHTATILRCGIMMDPVTSVPEDPDPVVWSIGADSAWLTNQACHGRPTTSSTYSNSSSVTYGAVIEGAFATMSADRSIFLYLQPGGYSCSASHGFGTVQSITNAGLPANPFNGKFEALPFIWVRPNYGFLGSVGDTNQNSQQGLKGWSSMARWTGVQRQFALDTLDTRKWIAMGCMWLPWDGTTTPT